jgi:hypothetical protein
MKHKRIESAIEGLNEVARGYFDELREILSDGRLKPGDEKPLARLCFLYSVLGKLEEEVNNAWGQTLPKGNMPLHDKYSKTVLMMETAFQLNPNARVKMKEQPKKEKKGFDTGMKVNKSA